MSLNLCSRSAQSWFAGVFCLFVLAGALLADEKVVTPIGKHLPLYGAAAPKTNAAKAPGEWQKMVIEFKAPRFEGEKKTASAKFAKVTLNGQVIHENVEMKGPTPSGITGKEAATGPLMFQGDHGPVAFRNIRITTK